MQLVMCNIISRILAPDRRFTVSVNLAVSFNVPQTDSCCHGNENVAILR